MEFLSHCSTAHNRAALQNSNAQSRSCEIVCAYQTIMTGPNDCDIQLVLCSRHYRPIALKSLASLRHLVLDTGYEDLERFILGYARRPFVFATHYDLCCP